MRISGTGVGRWAAILLLASTAGCGDGPGVTTGESSPAPTGATISTSTLPTPSNNLQLANAADYFLDTGSARAGYYFESPSGRWRCAILPHAQAGCQSASGSAIGIQGAPDTVTNSDGTTDAPNAIVVEETGEAHFAVLSKAQSFAAVEPAKVLPFNEVLDAAGFRCNFQESVGVSCASETSAQGFTFSSDGYTLQYTDIRR
ncbi:hypothetical protein NJB18091_45700 [Mycobacterium marinum]|uniref:hypothetical protein n=1 Tax=Mycobacterium marinum TaxID=1781 RepID=UPI0021C32328|nr:hypothetical protein [Mycobacterium marinum]GJO05810.1 hypothetical protein NJB18091_45700 [Mycobacterium marinum]